MSAAEILEDRFAAYDRLDQTGRDELDRDRFVPVPELRDLVRRALDGEFREDDMVELGRRNGRRSSVSLTPQHLRPMLGKIA